jgi:hypothetical protein
LGRVTLSLIKGHLCGGGPTGSVSNVPTPGSPGLATFHALKSGTITTSRGGVRWHHLGILEVDIAWCYSLRCRIDGGPGSHLNGRSGIGSDRGGEHLFSYTDFWNNVAEFLIAGQRSWLFVYSCMGSGNHDEIFSLVSAEPSQTFSFM